ncbi:MULTISPECIES: hypothetical protein [unclassified Streptomyces]|uniref:hypothetical protein n=1 Tax=unclassified Streptomyces TaxID=2593676 RepID=UPI0022596A06|nr:MULTISPECIES: hypothetical protein [unclassified Streptomyces]MCX4524431.1 hypothetical protein [Streptomyces sp. NBC_01551]MCX4545047.1 hypothetical protein [Streptomyces sp. NBC_01565]
MDAETVLAGSEVVVELAGFTGYYNGSPVAFRLRRRTADGAWLYEFGSPVAEVTALAGVAREEDIRSFAQGILDTLEAGGGEPDFTLYDDGYTETIATVGYGPELYLSVEAAFDFAQDRVGTSPSGEELYSNPFGGAHVYLGEISPAEPEVLAGLARELLAALDG